MRSISRNLTGPSASVAVIVVNANAGDLLERTLSALDRQTVRPRRVIVVDNASIDGSADGIESRYPAVEVVRFPLNLGFAAANNVAVQAAEDCDWIALLNPDAFPEPDWLETLLAAASAHPEYSFFGSRLLKADDPTSLDGAGDVYHVSGMAWRHGHGSPASEDVTAPHEIFSPCAAAALYRRDAFRSIDGFDETFFCYFEDSDLSFRLRLAGHRCLYVPTAVVHHVGSALAGIESEFTLYHSFRNLIWTYAKNMPSPLLWLYLPQHVLVNVLILGSFTMRGQGGVILRAQRDALRGLPAVLGRRRRVQAARRVGALELRRAMATGIDGYRTTFARGLERYFTRTRPSVSH